jgi:LDH2 family malate/lactate/ureidoglycolate dehydrogenase
VNKPAKLPGDKNSRYRARKRAQGLRDVNAPGFKEEAERQAALLRGLPEEKEILDEISALIDETWKDLD